MDDSTTKTKKIPVKIALGRKWIRQQDLWTPKRVEGQSLPEHRLDMQMDSGAFHQVISELENAYIAGFDKARELAVDICKRIADPHIPENYAGAPDPFSHHVAQLGESPYPVPVKE